LKIAICDDEENVRTLIKTMILENKTEVTIDEFEDGCEIEKADVFQYDIVFLDVSMKKQSGVETARHIREKQQEKKEDIWGSFPLIIFITGYSEYMPDAFSFHAFGYLVKPLKKEEFNRCFSKATEECEKRNDRNEPKSLLIKVGTATRKIFIDDIEYVESEKRKNIIHLKNEKLIYYGSMEDLEQTLTKEFFRIHKGYLVNMKYVEKYDRIQLWMRSGDCLLISKYRYGSFVKAYMELLTRTNI
jgi:two-component system LytT family response regulator/two-component system response regulator LytT